MNKRTITIISSTIIVLLIGLGGGYYLGTNQDNALTPSPGSTNKQPANHKKILFYRNPMNPKITSPVPTKDEMGMDYVPVYADKQEPASQERKILFYRNPMNPKITSPMPTKDEMGMDYVPVYADGAASSTEPSGTVTIDPVMEQNIGVRTAITKEQVLSRDIKAVGRVAYDEETLYTIYPKVEGWIEQLFIQKTGEQVQQDTILLSIYSPQLVASEQEYLLALKNLETLKDSPYAEIRQGAQDLADNSLKRLEFLDVPAHQIKELTTEKVIKKSLHIHSPYAGIVMKLGVREGQFVTPKTQLYMVADLSKVWVYVDVYEYELPWIALGDKAKITVSAVPGRVFTGTVDYIYPYMEKKTRTAKIRLIFANPDGLLKPEMFANVTLKAGKNIKAVVIPSEALVRSGSRIQVFVQRAPGKFEPREVKVGVSSAGLSQIISGVKVGEEVVTSSQFLIDSESKLREATAKMLETIQPQTNPATTSSMDDMNMDDLTMDKLEDVK